MEDMMELKWATQGTNPKTGKHYPTFQVFSALQKSIRRGMEEEAMYWAMELLEGGSAKECMTRLRVIAHEDIGIADIQSVLFALQCLDDLENKWYIVTETKKKQKNGKWKTTTEIKSKGQWRLALANVILSLCRANKSRISDNFQGHIRYKKSHGWALEIPDYALDKHTKEGRKLGKGTDQFFDEGVILHPKINLPKDEIYEENFRKFSKEKEERKLKEKTEMKETKEKIEKKKPFKERQAIKKYRKTDMLI